MDANRCIFSGEFSRQQVWVNSLGSKCEFATKVLAHYFEGRPEMSQDFGLTNLLRLGAGLARIFLADSIYRNFRNITPFTPLRAPSGCGGYPRPTRRSVRPCCHFYVIFFTAGNNRCNGEKRGRAAPLSASFSLYLIDTTYWGGFGFPQRVRKTEVIGWLVGIVLLVPAKKGSDRIGKQMIESVKILLYRA